MKYIIKKVLICLLGISPFFGTIYIIGRLRKKEEAEGFEIYESFKEGLIPYFKIMLPAVIISFLFRRSLLIDIDPTLIFLYPKLFLPILIKLSLILNFFDSFIKSSFFITAIKYNSLLNIRDVLLDIKTLSLILVISTVCAFISTYLAEISGILNWKLIISLIYIMI